MFQGRVAREAKKRGYQKIITYLRHDKSGSTLKAAGWQLAEPGCVPASADGGRTISGKTRWARVLVDVAKPSFNASTPVSLAFAAPLVEAFVASAELDYAD